MKILLIVDDYMPDSIKVGAKMMHELACEFFNTGHSVTVLTPSSSMIKSKEIVFIDNITVCKFKTGKIKNTGKIKRSINETLLSFSAWTIYKKYFKNNKHDLIVYYSPSIFFGNLVAKLKKLWNAPSYLILRDLFPQWAIDQNLIRKNSIIEKYFRYFEKRNYLAANTIGLMSEKNMEMFQKEFYLSSSLEVLYNWAANSPVEMYKNYKKILNIENKIVYFYGGNIGYAQDMLNILRLADNMKNEKKAHFVLVGAGDEFELIQNTIQKGKYTNVSLLPSVSQIEYKEMLASFDIGLFTLHKDHTTHNFPGKILGYMVQRLPILGSINDGNDLKAVVENAGAGLITINGDDQLFLDNAKLLLNESLREEKGKKAEELLNLKFSVRSAANKILKSI